MRWLERWQASRLRREARRDVEHALIEVPPTDLLRYADEAHDHAVGVLVALNRSWRDAPSMFPFFVGRRGAAKLPPDEAVARPAAARWEADVIAPIVARRHAVLRHLFEAEAPELTYGKWLERRGRYMDGSKR